MITLNPKIEVEEIITLLKEINLCIDNIVDQSKFEQWLTKEQRGVLISMKMSNLSQINSSREIIDSAINGEQMRLNMNGESGRLSRIFKRYNNVYKKLLETLRYSRT